MNHQPTLETERLIMRPFNINDADTVMALAGTKQVYATTLNVPHPYEPGMAEKWISGHASQFYNGTDLTLAIMLKSTGEIVGTIGIGITKAHSRGELGYWIGHQYWGNGYCTEAAKAIMEYAFNIIKLHKITSRYMEINPASGRVMEKAGMIREGKLVDEVTKDGIYHSLVVYGRINSERIRIDCVRNEPQSYPVVEQARLLYIRKYLYLRRGFFMPRYPHKTSAKISQIIQARHLL